MLVRVSLLLLLLLLLFLLLLLSFLTLLYLLILLDIIFSSLPLPSLHSSPIVTHFILFHSFLLLLLAHFSSFSSSHYHDSQYSIY